jgi:hypothetical protein
MPMTAPFRMLGIDRGELETIDALTSREEPHRFSTKVHPRKGLIQENTVS